MNDSMINKELSTLESERKMSEIALKGHQNELARKLRGSMGEDIMKTIEPKKKDKNGFFHKVRNGFDNLLRML